MPTVLKSMANNIVNDRESLTVAMGIVIRSHSEPSSIHGRLVLSEKDREQATRQLSQNILDAAWGNRLLKTGDPSMLLWGVARFSPEKCPDVFAAIKQYDPTLDCFVLKIMSREFDSSKGVVYAIPHDQSILEKYCSLADLQEKATKRLHSPDLRLASKGSMAGFGRKQEILWRGTGSALRRLSRISLQGIVCFNRIGTGFKYIRLTNEFP